MQQSDVLDIILRALDSQTLVECDPVCPTGLDYLYDYADGVMLNPWYIDLKEHATTAGLFELKAVSTYAQMNGTEGPAGGLINSDSPFTSFENNILAADCNRVANTSHYHKPRGSYVIDGIFVAAHDSAAVSLESWD